MKVTNKIPNVRETKKITTIKEKDVRSIETLRGSVKWHISVASSIAKWNTEILTYRFKKSDVRKVAKELAELGYSVELPSLSSLPATSEESYYFNMLVSWK